TAYTACAKGSLPEPESAMSVAMSPDEIANFLQTPRFAAVASLRRDGSPHVIPLGFRFDGTNFYLSISNGRGLIGRVRRDPRVSLTIFNEAYPAVGIVVHGSAAEIPDPGDAISRAIAQTYVAPSAELDFAAFERRWLAPGRTVFRVVPIQVFSWDLGKTVR